MKKVVIALSLLLLFSTGFIAAEKMLQVDPEKYLDKPSFLGYVQDRFIVILKDNVTVDHRKDAQNRNALSSVEGFDALAQKYQVTRLQPQFPGSDLKSSVVSAAEPLARYYKVNISNGTLEDAMADYAGLADVERVEAIGVHTLHATPNDTYYDNPPPEFPYDQWHYWDTYGIEADQAWNTETGAQTVIVGDLDTGTKYDHGDLGGSNPPGPNDASTNGNIWVNTNEIPGNSIDDDGNGYVDDVIGWDFVDRTNWYIYTCTDLDCGGADNDPSDGNGHGTHTAGTIAAISNNGYAVAGVAGGFGDGTFAGGGNGVKVVPCRIGYTLLYQGQDLGVVIMDYVAEAMYYMGDLKASGWNVAAINCSFGTSNSGGLEAACDYLISQDVMVIVSAGNSNSSSADYLASRTDCMDVGATDQNGNPASFSNYGSWVEVAAPGVMVMSTLTDPTDPSGDYIAPMDGTSMSCPHVVGVAALLESYDPSLTAQDKWDLIVNNTKPYNMTKNVGVGIVDVKACLDAIGPTCDVAADFSANTTSGCDLLTVNFTDLSTGTGVDGWSWTFGDGGTSTAQNPSHTYTSAGTFTVTLTASSSSQSCDDVAAKTNYITVSSSPTAGFVGSPISGDYPLTVNFTNQSSGASSYSWLFGDGGTSTAANPSHTYTTAGTYTVTQTVTNSCGSDQFVRTDYITVTEPPCNPPVADFSGSPTSGEYPLTVDFSDASTYSPTSWSWTFGDGGTSTAQNPSHTYNTAGTYTVTLTATNSCGSDGETKVDYITVTEPGVGTSVYAQSDIPVIGTVSGDYTNTFASDDVYETITEIEYTGHPRKTYSYLEHKWDFSVDATGAVTFYVEAYRPNNSDGDNFTFAYSTDNATYINLVTVASSTEQVYSAALPNGLTGTVYIRVLDSDRNWAMISNDPIYIDQMYIEYESTPGPPVADFSGTPTSGSYPLNVSFTDLSSGNPTSWSWTFGDGGTSTAQNPSHTYNTAGVYTVSLTAGNAYGSDGETKVDYITVTEPGNDYMFVENMAVGRRKVGPNYLGTCIVTIYDNNNQPVSNATVYATATGPTGGNLSGQTGADGTVTLETSSMKRPPGEWCFEVTNVTHATLPYDDTYNVMTQVCESGVIYGFSSMMSDLLPTQFELHQNFPNPFNPNTTISFSIPDARHVNLSIYNIMGQKIASLVDRHLEPGVYSFDWNAGNEASGIYLYRIVAGQEIETRQMLLLK